MLVQRELERMVLAGELAAGEKLNELALAERLGVSRGPVREALRRARRDRAGAAREEPRRRSCARSRSPRPTRSTSCAPPSTRWRAGSARSTIRPEQLAELRAVVKRMQDAAIRDDHEGYHLANLRFHDAIVEFAGNAKLLQMYRRLVNELSLFRRHTLAEPRRCASRRPSTRRSSP
jgi:DNA-binding GntR family transcriptional regulator